MKHTREDKETPDEEKGSRQTRSDDLMYRIDDTPPW